MSYRYPDIGDRLHSAWLDELAPEYRAYYVRSEREILGRMREWLKMRHPQGARLLDVGAGEGRLIEPFLDLVHDLVLLEPDLARAAAARQSLAALGLAERVAVHAERLEEFRPDQRFDAILCSHVVQHVPTHEVPRLLARFREALLAPEGGTLLLTTAHSESGADRFVKAWLEEERTVGCAISRPSFDALATDAEAAEVPTCQFSCATLARLLTEAGFAELERRVFHVSPEPAAELGRFGDIDFAVNQTPERRDMFGRDIFLAGSTCG